MNFNDITTLISSVGFPIAACCYMAYAQSKQTISHREEVNALKDALNNNTLVLQKLVDRMGD